MTRNVGSLDRVIRIIAGGALAVFASGSSGLAAGIMWAAAAVALFTGLVGWCGLYTVLGINTCRVDKP